MHIEASNARSELQDLEVCIDREDATDQSLRIDDIEARTMDIFLSNGDDDKRHGDRETKAGLIVLGFKYYLSHLIHSF